MNFGQVSLTKKVLRVILYLAILALLYFFVRYFINRGSVPDDFIEARRQSSVIASQIVRGIESSLSNLDLIAENDRNYNFHKALGLVYLEQDKAKEGKAEALKLNKQLNVMASAVPFIKPEGARNAALGSVSEEVSLISHLINYDSYFSGLLDTLKLKFSGDISYDSSDVQTLIQNMNSEAKEINKLNDSFNNKMAEFDKIISDSYSFL
ncbi:MAG: Uncharacterized protein Athens071426_191 [Parcubacteria group bacterium Athens0714_26]|nr:MAG: Uncharacterized protein Athens101426_416 [Parcubacteria group bacterium Athens1014_26]TSD03594.1 MAG: Uncharacterized protein Athens071426_191 [Parcubacteria group bacterium Athens0714_26]